MKPATFTAGYVIVQVLLFVESMLGQAIVPNFSQAVFSNGAQISNPYLPFLPGQIATYRSDDIDLVSGEVAEQTVIVEVLEETKVVAGVISRVVRDRVFEEGRVIEDTFDWYAQDDVGNVWYMGEMVTDYEYDDEGQLTNTTHPGAWSAGVDGAQAGLAMPAVPSVGQHYYQEYYPGVAVDEAHVTSVEQSFTVPMGSFTGNVLQTRDTTALEPDVFAAKYYAPGIGPIAERGFAVSGDKLTSRVDRNPQSILPRFDPGNFVAGATIDNQLFPLRIGKIYDYRGQKLDSSTGEITQLGFQEIHTDRTQEIMGIPTRIVRGIEYHDGLKIEDSEFYYAQDKEGTVWWMGEFSTKFKYDEDDNLVGTYDDSAWYAGVNGAQPGYYMPGTPQLGVSYYEMFAPLNSDIDTMKLLSLSANASTIFGELSNVAIVYESSDFDRGLYAHKYYAPGVGLVRVQEDFDKQGNPRVFLELTNISSVPEPAAWPTLVGALICAEVVRRKKSS